MKPAEPPSDARRFLEKLHDKKVFDEWVALPKDDPQQIGELVKRVLDLTTVPTAEDLRAMSDEIEAPLREYVRATQQSALSWTGAMFATQAQSGGITDG